MHKNLAAYTSPASNAPSYVNFSSVDDAIEITVRGPATGTLAFGPVAAMRLSKAEFGRLIGELLERLFKDAP